MRLGVIGALMAVAALAASAGTAGASPAIEGPSFVQSSVFSIVPPLGATHVHEAEVPLFVRGTLSVSFHSDPASGCAALGGCAYSGTMVYKPSGGQLLETSYRLHGRAHREASVLLGSLSSAGSDELYTRVTRQVAGGAAAVCADATPAGGFLPGHPSAGQFAFPLAAGLSSTRCAGPIPDDLAGALPVLRFAMPAPRGARADLRHVSAFAGHGFAGTVTSTLQFSAGRPSSSGPGTLPPGLHRRRIRYVQRDVKVAAETGTLSFDVRGTPEGAVCILLDSCGLTGTMTLTPDLAGVTGSIATGGPATKPEAYYVRALFGRGRRLVVDGGLSWDSAGTLQTSLRQSATCTDTAAGGPGGLVLATSSGRLRVQYSSQGSLFRGLGSDRSRCPGPKLAVQATLASGSVPRGALGARTATIVLRAGAAFPDDGYDVTPHGQVTVTLRFGRISQTFFWVPAP